MKSSSMLIIISIFIISNSFELNQKGENSIRFLELAEETDLNMTSFEEVKPAIKPIMLGFNSKKSDNEDNKINEINIFFKNVKGKSETIFKKYIYFLVNYIPTIKRRRLKEQIVQKALKGKLKESTLKEDIVEYKVINEYDDMESFNLEKNVQFLDNEYNLEYIQTKLNELDNTNTDVSFNSDFSFDSNEQNFNKKFYFIF